MGAVLSAELETVTDQQPAERAETAPRPWQWYWPALFFAPLPMLLPYLVGLWQLDHYQYVPALLVAVPALAYCRSNGMIYPPRNWVAWLMLGGGLVSVAVSAALFSPWFSAVGAVLIGAALLYSLRGPLDATLFGLAVPLAMFVRLPGDFDQLLILRLQGWTTRFASLMLDLASIPHSVGGNVIELASRELFVAEACSGIQSVFSIAFLATLIIAYRRHPLWFTPFYLGAAIVIAVLGNSLRVCIVAIADAKFAVDWSSGLAHAMVGYATLVLGALLLLSFDQFVLTVFHPIKSHDAERWPNPISEYWNQLVTSGPRTAAAGTLSDATALDPVGDSARASAHSLAPAPGGDELTRHKQPQDSSSLAAAGKSATAHNAASSLSSADGGSAAGGGRTRRARVLVPVCGVIIGVFSIAQITRTWAWPRASQLSSVVYFAPPDRLFDDAFQSVQLVGYEVARDSDNPRYGKAADIWTVRHDHLAAQIMLSQPYFGWHELCVCYENLKWNLVDRSILGAAAGDGGSLPSAAEVPFALARFRRGQDQYGYLFFSAIDYHGGVSTPPPGLGDLTRLTQRLRRDDSAATEELMMLQLWLESPTALTQEELQVFKETFLAARGKIVSAVRSTAAAPSPVAKLADDSGPAAAPNDLSSRSAGYPL